MWPLWAAYKKRRSIRGAFFYGPQPLGVLGKHHSAMAVDHNPMFNVHLHGPRQHLRFHTPARGNVIFHREVVRNPRGFLLDNRAFIQVRRYVMGGGANQLYPTRLGLMVRLGPFEGGQEGMVDVNHPPT